MPHSKNSEKQPESPVRQLADLKQLVQTYLQEYLEQEVACHLGALPYERDVGVFQGIAFDLAEVSLSQERSKIKILGDLVAADRALEEEDAPLWSRPLAPGVWREGLFQDYPEGVSTGGLEQIPQEQAQQTARPAGLERGQL